MASGDNVVVIEYVMPPGSSYATEDVRPGGSTPAENVIVYDFSDGADKYVDFMCRLEGYDGGGLTFTIVWSATTATSGNVVIDIAIRRLAFDAEDIDAAHTYDFNSVTDAAPSTSGYITNATITFTNGSDMDSWANNEWAIVRIRRNGDDASDTMTDTMELWGIVGKETET